MQLKTLKVKGFKSFADPTTIEFDQGVTAVVGPNGSGKSNVIEAIRWVMGEQSAKSLRGGRMNDVIFSGTNSRKPMNIAEVTLTLDNSTGYLPIDYNEVSITRWLNRNGDSDYAINKQDCRLRDIVELFMDSGLGKESFSIISQGQVESIFNAKPEDRRAIFEEAAGVFKYKVQKQQAERKLEDAQGNLDRVQDILYELEGQVEPLKDQAERAQKYQDLKAELTETDVSLSVIKINTFAEDMNQTKEALAQIQKEIEITDQTLSQDIDQQEELKSEQEGLSNQRESLQESLLDMVQSIERTENSLTLKDEQAKHKAEFLESKQESLRSYQSDLERLQETLDEKSSQRNDLNETIQELNEDLKVKRDRLSLLQEGADDRIEDLRGEYIDLMQAKASLNNEEQSLNQQTHKFLMQKERQSQSHQQILDDLKADQESLAEKEEELETVSQELNDLLEDYQQLDTNRKQFNERYQVHQNLLQQLKNDYEQARARYASLENMQKSYAGYYAGVKEIMQNQDNLQGIVGTVADLISIPKKYLEAIDTSLGSNSQFIVVQDEAAGRSAIDYLKRNKAGRATFLPLTTIKPRYIQSNLLTKAQQLPGYIGVASDLVDFSDQVSTIIENLLGNTIVAEDLKAANQIARAIQFRHRVVSLDGNVMNAGGSMTGGGSRSHNAHIFTQKDELDQLAETIKDLGPKIEEQEAAIESLTSENATTGDRLEEIRSEGERKRYAENNLKNDISHLKDNLKQLEQQVKASEFEQADLDSDHKDAKDRLAEIAEEKDQVAKQLEAVNQEMTELSEAKEDSSQKQTEIMSEIDQISSNLAQYREELASTNATLDNVQAQRRDVRDSIEKITSDIESYQAGEESDVSKEELTNQLADLRKTYDQQKASDQDLKAKLAELGQDLNDLELKVKAGQAKLQDLQTKRNQKEIALSRLEVNLDHQLNYLVEEYGVSFEEANQDDQKLDMDFDQAADAVKRLKQSISNLGPVNLNAIEEYKQISERHEFLSEQQADLLEAKSELRNTMDAMDEEVKTRFKASFDQIKAQFTHVFPQLFGGGRAELRLTDPDDLLTSGVDIIAQPPGKSLSSLSLLSGGERALTAISLLFAIIQVSPVPFCILDEAEAALDESNVTRFGQYLHNFETDTQFIVITHRRGTMEQADRLYGITMQEKGVSKLVSVRLDEVDQVKLED